MNIDRYYSRELRPFGNLNKPIKLVNEKHLQWIRDRECVVSGVEGDNDPHHVQKKSQIRNDYLTIPLRHQLHMDLHAGGDEKFEKKHAISIEHALIAQLVERIISLENIIKGR